VNTDPRFLATALAGGRSRRFGRDKAVEEIDGVSLVERAVRTLNEVASEVVVISGRDLGVDVACLPDLRIDTGPLAGIETALSRARDLGMDAALVLACDMPLVRATTMRALADAVAGGSVAAVAVGRDQAGSRGSFEPLCAAYRTELLADASALLDDGVHAAGALFERVGGARVECPSEELLNVNTPADADAAAAALGRSTR
jgi:molybdopterin-guanine dinucleotide biosynthesis protein A